MFQNLDLQFILFYCLLMFTFVFVSVFWLLWVSSLAYPNLLGTKRLGCCCCLYVGYIQVFVQALEMWNLFSHSTTTIFNFKVRDTEPWVAGKLAETSFSGTKTNWWWLWFEQSSYSLYWALTNWATAQSTYLFSSIVFFLVHYPAGCFFWLSFSFLPVSWIGLRISVSRIQLYTSMKFYFPESVEGLFSSLTFAEYMASSQERCWKNFEVIIPM
jgi:hypothetical protein